MPIEATVWTEERKEQLRELTKQGYSSEQIGQRWGLDARTIRNVRGRLGFTLKRSANWPEERIEALKALWAEGTSASIIAQKLGLPSRSAVLGKVHRLGLPPRKVVERRPVNCNSGKTYRPRERRMTMQQNVHGRRLFEFAVSSDLPATHADNPCNLIDLPANGCHWPCEGEGFKTVFCGGNAVKGLSYCPRHCRMAYRPGVR